MRTLTKMDERGRVQFPKRIRRLLKLRSGELFTLEVRENTVFIRKLKKPDESMDPMLRDILVNPARSKIRVTKALLDRLEEEQWST